MKILDRYVITTFLKNYLISFFVLIGLYVTLDMVFNFDELVQVQERANVTGGLDSALVVIKAAANYYFYQLFYIYVQLSGMIPVVAAAFTLIRLSRFNELSAMLSAGVPLLRIASPIIIVALVLNGLLLLDQELLIPEIIPKLVRSRQEAGQETSTKDFQIPAMQDDKNAVLNVARYRPAAVSPVMYEMTLIERNREFTVANEAGMLALANATVTTPAARKWDIVLRSDNHKTYELFKDKAGDISNWREVPAGSVSGDRPIAKIVARRADWDPATKSWLLTDARRDDGLLYNTGRKIDDTIAFYKSNITPEEINLYRQGNYVELLPTRRIDELLARPQSYGTVALLRVKHNRFTQPLVNIVLLLLAIPCVLSREPTRLKAAATKCLILTGLCLCTSFLGQQLTGQPPSSSIAQQWPAIMAWMPLLIFGPIAVYLLDRVET